MFGALAMLLPLTGCYDLYQQAKHMLIGCDEDSRPVTMAKALSPERLSRLYNEARKLLQDTTVPHGSFRVVIDPIPRQFEDLEPLQMRVVSDNFGATRPRTLV